MRVVPILKVERDGVLKRIIWKGYTKRYIQLRDKGRRMIKTKKGWKSVPRKSVIPGMSFRRNDVKKHRKQSYNLPEDSLALVESLKNLIAVRESIVSIEQNMQVLESMSSTQGSKNTGEFYLDSGAMAHSHDSTVTPQTDVEYIRGVEVTGLFGKAQAITNKATVTVPPATEKAKVLLKSLDVKQSRKNLVSIGQLVEAGMEVYMGTKATGKPIAEVRDNNGNLLLYAEMKNRLFALKTMEKDCITENVTQLAKTVKIRGGYTNFDSGTLQIFHEMLGHRAFSYVRRVMGFPPMSTSCLDPICIACHEAQFRNLPIKREALTCAPRVGYRLCSDVSAKLPRTSYRANHDVQRYQLTVDEYSEFL